jgi:hypothetical protein
LNKDIISDEYFLLFQAKYIYFYVLGCPVSHVTDTRNRIFTLFQLSGFCGCEHAVTDVRCTQSARKFYSGEAFDSAARTFMINWYLFFSIALIWWWSSLETFFF